MEGVPGLSWQDVELQDRAREGDLAAEAHRVEGAQGGVSGLAEELTPVREGTPPPPQTHKPARGRVQRAGAGSAASLWLPSGESLTWTRGCRLGPSVPDKHRFGALGMGLERSLRHQPCKGRKGTSQDGTLPTTRSRWKVLTLEQSVSLGFNPVLRLALQGLVQLFLPRTP